MYDSFSVLKLTTHEIASVGAVLRFCSLKMSRQELRVVILKARIKILFANLPWPGSRFLILTSMTVTMS